MDRDEGEIPGSAEAGWIHAEDMRVVEQLRRGDAAAGQQFVRDHYPGVYYYLLYLTGRPELAEDLAQETFLQAWRNLHQFQGRAPMRVWLHRIARREFLQEVRRRRSVASLEQIAEVAAPGAADWTEAMDLRDAIGKLPVEEGEVVTLHYLQGYDCQEIAQIVRTPVGTVKYRLAMGRAHLQRALGEDDLIYVNEQQSRMRRWAWLPLERMRALETGLTPGPGAGLEEPNMPSDKLSRRGFLATAAGAGAAALTAANEPDVVDDRLTRKLTLALKGMALADLCAHLSSETGVQIVAGPSVADEKVTLFCKGMPLRDVMRQLARPFGYAWSRSRTKGVYRYELTQDLRSQLLEEELRERDRNEALLALDQEMQRYRPFLDLSPEEAEERARTATPNERPLLENLARYGWGPIQMYFRLSRNDLSVLRAGQPLVFSTAPRPGDRELPPDLGRAVFQGLRYWRVWLGQQPGDQLAVCADDKAAEKMPDHPPPAAMPEARVRVDLSIHQKELGRFAFSGGPGLFSVSDVFKNFDVTGPDGPWAIGMSPTVIQPKNKARNARLALDATLRARVVVQPSPSCRIEPYPGTVRYPRGGEPEVHESGDRVTSADVLEALHHATGLPIVSDYYTRLYPPEAVSVRDLSRFDALNQLADTMRLRWDRDKEGGWLRFRSASFYDDRIKEVPNRLLARCSATRREHESLRLDDLVEIAQLSDAQLDAQSMAEGARACYGLVEWELARHPVLRPHLRDMAAFTPAQRQEALGPNGLRFTRMSMEQQQRFITQALDPKGPPLQSIDELEGSTLWVDYLQPGWFRWVTGYPGPWQTWLMSGEPGVEAGRRVPRPRVRERTREAALQALRRIDPKLRAAIWESFRRDNPNDAPPADLAGEIWPTDLDLIFIYIPGASHKRPIRIFSAGLISCQWTE